MQFGKDLQLFSGMNTKKMVLLTQPDEDVTKDIDKIDTSTVF